MPHGKFKGGGRSSVEDCDYASLAFGRTTREKRTEGSAGSGRSGGRSFSDHGLWPLPRRNRDIPLNSSSSEQFWVRTPRKRVVGVTPPRAERKRATPTHLKVSQALPPSPPNSVNASWVTCYDDDSGYEYYYNTISGESVWELPPGAMIAGRNTTEERSYTPSSSSAAAAAAASTDECSPTLKKSTRKKNASNSTPPILSGDVDAPAIPFASCESESREDSATKSPSPSQRPLSPAQKSAAILKINRMRVRDMKTFLASKDVDCSSVVEKQTLVRMVQDCVVSVADAEHLVVSSPSADDVSTRPAPSNDDENRENEEHDAGTIREELRELRETLSRYELRERTETRALAAETSMCASVKEEMAIAKERHATEQSVLFKRHEEEMESCRNSLEASLRRDAEKEGALRTHESRHAHILADTARHEDRLRRAMQELEDVRLRERRSEEIAKTRLTDVEASRNESLRYRQETERELESHEAHVKLLAGELRDARDALRLRRSEHENTRAETVDRLESAFSRRLEAEEATLRADAERELVSEREAAEKRRKSDVQAALKELKRRMKREKRRALAEMETTALRSFEDYEVQEADRFAKRDAEHARALEEASSRHAAVLENSEAEARTKLMSVKTSHAASLRSEAEIASRAVDDRSKAVAAEHIALARATKEADRAATEAKELRRWREQYVAEADKRRVLQKELIDLRGNIRVLCRVRPMLPFEVKREGAKSTCVTFPFAATNEDGLIDVVDRERTHRFDFDAVFDGKSSQEDVFDQVEPLVASVVDGYNCCIFANGQTGSGKTYTMEGGDGEKRGVYRRSIESLFRLSEHRRLSEGASYVFKMSMMEIYNETIRDLLIDSRESASVPRGGLTISTKKRGKRGTASTVTEVEIDGLTILPMGSARDMERALKMGAKSRAVGSHNVNERSSRSHLVLTIYAEGRSRDGSRRTRGKLNLIDLSGSERLAKTGATGVQLKEAKYINKSLSALGNVISALADKKGHVPFRNSKLTFALQDSLSGNSKVLMFVNCSPARSNSSETLCSLRFASRCRKCALGRARANVSTSHA